MSSMLTIYNTTDWQSLAAAVTLPQIDYAQINTSPSGNLVLSPLDVPKLQQAIQNLGAEQSLCIACVQAEHFIAQGLEQGLTLEQAGDQWLQLTQSLLNLQVQKRRQIRLFNLHQALGNPDALAASLGDLMPINNYAPLPPSENFALLVACQHLAQTPELQAVNARLQASCLSLSQADAITLDLARILQEKLAVAAKLEEMQFAQQQQAQQITQLNLQITNNQANIAESAKKNATLEQTSQKLSSELAATSSERDLLLSQLHSAQEQLEEIYQQQQLSQKSAQDQLNEVSESLAQKTEELESALTQLQQQKQITQTLTSEKQQLSEKLAGLDATNQTNRVALAQAEKNLAAQENRNQQLIAEQQKQNDELKNTAEERDLILSQLHQVQEELENYYVQLQDERKTNKHTLTARDKQAAKEIAKMEESLKKAKAKAASAEYASSLLQQELDKIRNSISWKTVKPVRALGRILHKPNVEQEKLNQQIGLLLTSAFFDVEWYLKIYPDVADANINPAEHYLLFGAAEGRLPGPDFDGNWYLQQYPDVAKANMNPLLHFVMFGQQEGRTSSPKLLTKNTHENEE